LLGEYSADKECQQFENLIFIIYQFH
jgi:hypothetical protein